MELSVACCFSINIIYTRAWYTENIKKKQLTATVLGNAFSQPCC
jgi:hypothetical protein